MSKTFRYMNLEQRIKIKEMLNAGHGISEIADDLVFIIRNTNVAFLVHLC